MYQRCYFMTPQQWANYICSLIRDVQKDNIWKGQYDTISQLVTAYPVAEAAWFVFVRETKSFWYWSDTLLQWVNQEITSEDYDLLTVDEKASVPYIIVPTLLT